MHRIFAIPVIATKHTVWSKLVIEESASNVFPYISGS